VAALPLSRVWAARQCEKPEPEKRKGLPQHVCQSNTSSVFPFDLHDPNRPKGLPDVRK